ncbi:tRNA (uridine(54)-C5)-methyltransferase TrmA [Viridibacterium curvum]|uniref:tRNA/tmRNA (uracil-C(5))-methyltransferase n=1 Tax=Viridibacterium curvum TaxID=1101404 RepID=A0ABP9R8K7_9RHOO
MLIQSLPQDYETQLAEKVAAFNAAFSEFGAPAPEVFASAPSHYRMRAEFRVWHQGERLDFAMSDPQDPKRAVVIESFPAASRRICDAMPDLRAYLEGSLVLRQRLFQVNFLSTLSGELMITLLYHRKLEGDWEKAAQSLGERFNAQVVGRSHKQKLVLGRDWLLEELAVGKRLLRYQQIEGCFSQPNAGTNRLMLDWATEQVRKLGGDLLELYCGNGNFTVALAPLFDKVLATEVSKSSTRAAHYNLDANGIGNVAIARMSSDEISDALAGGREYRRLRNIHLDTYRFSTIFVDPPRSGLDPATVELARGFANILYISCNLRTLKDNVAALQATHSLVSTAVFDQFPYTHHMECGVLLKLRA